MKDNKLMIGGVSAEDLAEVYGTPLYVYDADKIVERFISLKKSISYPKTKIYYACKANGNPEILKMLREMGVDGIDAVSLGETKLAMAAGFKPDQISLTNPSLSEEQLRYLYENGIELKVDSISQLRRWTKLNSESWIRINPGSGFGHHEHVNTGGPKSKFGIYLNEIEQAKKIAGKVIGLHQHPGSDVLDVNKFLHPLDFLYKTAKKFPDLEGINVGGGLGVAYKPESSPLNIKEFGKRLSESFSEFCTSYGRDLTLCLEPGRYFVAESGFLLARVNAIKESSERKFAIVDTGFNHFIRPVLYGSYHKAVNASKLKGRKEKVWVGGNVCESGDLLTDEREITCVEEGDLIAILNTGAYGYSMASNYTGADMPAEIMVSRGEHRLVRKRRGID
jgi:diaminopimelate decarboxylase